MLMGVLAANFGSPQRRAEAGTLRRALEGACQLELFGYFAGRWQDLLVD